VPTFAVTVGGVAQPIRVGSLNIQEVANGINTLRASFVSAGGAFRPALGAELVVTRDGVRIFGGYVATCHETGVGQQPLLTIETLVDADSFHVIADRRFVYVTIPAGATLKQGLQLLEPYITPYGGSLSASQADGPAFTADVVFAGDTLRQAIDRLSQLSGYVGSIDYSKVLRMVSFGEVPSPFNIAQADGSQVGDVEVERSRAKYFNRVIVKYGGSATAPVDHVDSFVGDGVQDLFELTYPIVGPVPPLPDSAVGYAVVDYNTYESLGGLLAVDTLWEYDPAALTVRRRAAPPVGPFQVRYWVQYPQLVMVEDAADIAANGLFETVVEYPTVFNKAEAIALGQSHLSEFLQVLQTVTLETDDPGLHPGQTITLTLPARNVTGPQFITEVQPYHLGTLTDLRYRVKVIDSTTFRGTYRQLYIAWLGGGSTTSANIGAAAPPPAGGGVTPIPPEGAIQYYRGGVLGASPWLTFQEAGTSIVVGDLSTITAVDVAACAVVGYDCHITDP